MALIEVENIYAGYDGTEVLHGISIHVDDREVVTIIGPNGAGKSTLQTNRYRSEMPPGHPV